MPAIGKRNQGVVISVARLIMKRPPITAAQRANWARVFYTIIGSPVSGTGSGVLSPLLLRSIRRLARSMCRSSRLRQSSERSSAGRGGRLDSGRGDSGGGSPRAPERRGEAGGAALPALVIPVGRYPVTLRASS